MIIQKELKDLKSRIRNKWGTVNNFYEQFESEFQSQGIKIAELMAIIAGRKQECVNIHTLDFVLEKVRLEPDNFCSISPEMKLILRQKLTEDYGGVHAFCESKDILPYEMHKSFRKKRFDTNLRTAWSAVGLPPVCATEEDK
jgi:hypothetical protein